jgi:hypothetical protein
MNFKFNKVNTHNTLFNDYLITIDNNEPFTIQTDYHNVRKAINSLNLILTRDYSKELADIEHHILSEFQHQYPAEVGFRSSAISKSCGQLWIPIENYQDIPFYNEKQQLIKYPKFDEIYQMRVIFQYKAIRVWKNSNIKIQLLPLQIQFRENFKNDAKLVGFNFLSD